MPRGRPGRAHVDGTSGVFVFGYASLVSPESVAATLGHPVDRSTFRLATLAGYRRSWCVGSDRRSHPERRFIRPDGTGYDGMTVVFGVQEAPGGAGCTGAVFPVSRTDLSLLDVRERNYRRVEVTDLVMWPGKPDGLRVFTYLPLPEAVARLRAAVASGRAVSIRRRYVDMVEDAFRSQGQLPAYRGSTPAPPYPVQDLDVRVDPSPAPPPAAP